MNKIALLFLFVCFLIHAEAQNPSFIWAHGYGYFEVDDNDDEVRDIDLLPEGKINVSGGFGKRARVNIFGADSVFDGNDEFLGLSITYDNQDNIVDSYKLGSFIRSSKRLTPNSLFTIGYFVESENFDLTDSSPFIVNSYGFSLINGYISKHSFTGELNWIDINTSIVLSERYLTNRVLTVGYFIGLGELLCPIDTIAFNTVGSVDGLIMSISPDGNLITSKTLGSEGNDIFSDCDHSVTMQEFTATGRSLGSSDYQWEGSVPMVVDHDGPAGFAVSYNDNYELTSLLIITNDETGQNDNCEFSGMSYDASGNLYISGIIEQGNYTLKLNDHEEDFIVTNPMELVMIKLSADKELQWIRRMPVGDFSLINRIDIDHNGFINACGYYNTSISFEGTNISYTDGGDYSGFIARWTPEGELVWAHTIYDSAGDNEIKDICITPQNYMYIGGYFTSFSTDFDFTEGQYDLGITNGEDAFLAKYTIANPTPDIFVEQGWQTTQVSEAGVEDAIYIRLSHIPSAAVQVTVTPDAQLDLGNGAGNSTTLTFGADSTAIQQQTINVAAWNDTAVEGPHIGQISFSVNSNDAAFDALTEDDITATITDNDVISIEENSALKFSVSPNPVKDELNISYNQFQHNTNLSIYDEVGQLVLITKANGTQQKINTSNLSSGRYSLVLMEGDSRHVMSFVKE